MNEYNEYFELRESDDEIEPAMKCLMCQDRGIWSRHLDHMAKGKRCVCGNCSAILVMVEGKVTVIGFKA